MEISPRWTNPQNGISSPPWKQPLNCIKIFTFYLNWCFWGKMVDLKKKLKLICPSLEPGKSKSPQLQKLFSHHLLIFQKHFSPSSPSPYRQKLWQLFRLTLNPLEKGLSKDMFVVVFSGISLLKMLLTPLLNFLSLGWHFCRQN